MVRTGRPSGEGLDILRRLREDVTPGTPIPKPGSTGPFLVKGWGRHRGEEALVYTIPNRKGGRAYEKGITASEFLAAWGRLATSGELTNRSFRRHLPGCAAEGSCNFTTLGGVFQLLGLARYDPATRGRYLLVRDGEAAAP